MQAPAHPPITVDKNSWPPEPPPGAEQRPDGSHVYYLEGGEHLIRWTRRPNGSWRRPERFRIDSPELRMLGRSRADAPPQRPAPEKQEPAPAPEKQAAETNNNTRRRQVPRQGPPRQGPPGDPEVAERVAQLVALGHPPEEAVPQPDGTFLLIMKDTSTMKWTKRPDGSWRKPEHKRAGWVGELEQEKYTPPAARAARAGRSGGSSGCNRPLDDFEYGMRGMTDPANPYRVLGGGLAARPPAPTFDLQAASNEFPDLHQANGQGAAVSRDVERHADSGSQHRGGNCSMPQGRFVPGTSDDASIARSLAQMSLGPHENVD